MDINIITIHYHPLSFLKESLKNNYEIFKKEKVNFKHYLIDNNYPLENQKEKVKNICEQYNITYLNHGTNLGMIKSKNYFHETIKPRDIIFTLESDAYLLNENTLTNIYQIHKNNDVGNVTYLNNKNLNKYNKEIFEINEVKVFKLDITHIDYTWIQCCFYNSNFLKKIQQIIDKDNRNNYDFPGEKNEEMKKENIPFLIINDINEDMEKYRYQNYFEYEYYKAFAYYWSKFEKQYENLTFEDFIKNYDYYLEMEDKFYGCYKNFKERAIHYVIKPNFCFEKTKIKFNKINLNDILYKNSKDREKKQEILKKIGRIL